jgi:three-Cys-motif partner protein
MTIQSETRADDGLIVNDVGAWARDKYRMIHLYQTLFSTGMKFQWDQRVYIDLYAGAGYSRLRGTQTILAGSPILALSVTDPFDKYIFCDEDSEKLNALRVRAPREHAGAEISYIEGDCNEKVSEIIAAIPPYSAQKKVLSLCFVDPYDLGIKFETLRRLATRYVDLLCLLALYMDANRNYQRYVSEDSQKVDDLLGRKDWREKWRAAAYQGKLFPRFLAEEFTESMASLDFIPPPIYSMKEVRNVEKNSPLYYLALFSRNPRAYEFWEQVRKYSTDQTSFDFEK